MSKKKRPGQWMDDVCAAIGRHVHVELSDGGLREGRLTGLGTREIEINGQPREFPIRIEFNGDPTDYVDFDLVTRMTID